MATPLLRGSAIAFALLWLANTCMNSQFGNYVNHLFGWGPQESAPLLVLIGIVRRAALSPRDAPRPTTLVARRRCVRAFSRARTPRSHAAAPSLTCHAASSFTPQMFLIAPGLLVPRLGLKRSIESGALIYGLGLLYASTLKAPALERRS